MNCNAIYEEADRVGREAFEACIPRPVIFGEAMSLFNDCIKPGTGRLETEGLCGFAWVEVRPTRSEFGSWLRKNGKGRYDDYRHCVRVSYNTPSQSMARKEAYSESFASVLPSYGIRAYADSRLD